MRSIQKPLLGAALLWAGHLAAQQPASGLYRLIQAGAEVGRESFRRDSSGYELSVVIPVLNLRIDSRTEYDDAGRFLAFQSSIMNAAGDTVRATWTLLVDGDTLRAVRARPATADTVRRARAMRADGVLPAQSIAIVPLLAQRAGGRDTTLRLLPMGSDSTISVTLHRQGDSMVVAFSNVTAYVALSGPGAGTVDVPMQRLTAPLWNGRDSLPPLTGLRPPVPDYAVPPWAPYTATEVRVPLRTAEGDTFSLAGTLTLPKAGRPPYPVVVTISGSGPQSRDEDLWPIVQNYRPFREIAERLMRAGIGVLRYDDRGVGGSGGNPGTSADYADDVRQIVQWLRGHAEVDGRRIGLLGHSEGGVMGPLVAADDPGIAAVVLMAGPSKTGRAIVRDQLRYPILTAPGLTAAEREARLAQADSGVATWAELNPWARWLADYDPLPTARRLRQPVLILQGALDRQVSVGQADTLAAAIRSGGNRDVTVRIYPRLNHLFLPTDGDGSPMEYAALKQTSLPAEVLNDLAGWLSVKLARDPR